MVVGTAPERSMAGGRALPFALPGYPPVAADAQTPRLGGAKYDGGTPPPPPKWHDPEEVVFPRGPGKVIGKDDRVRVPDPTAAPFRHVCALRIEAADGTLFVGTGWLVAPRTVITAGHCLHIRECGGPVRAVHVFPALNEGTSPYGSATASTPESFEVHEAWVRDQDERFDFGAIFLPAGGFPACGTFGFAAAADAVIHGAPLNVSGYPRDLEDASHPYFHGRVAKAMDAHVLQYETDTYGGQSGSPVWIDYKGAPYAVGIHTSGGPAFNQAVRIDRTVFDRLLTWKKRGSL
jgi:V8-like Glu-specific endopeptidase